METNGFKTQKKLKWIPIGLIHKVDNFRIYTPGTNQGLKASIQKSGVIEPLSVIVRDKKHILINGYERIEVLEQDTNFGYDFKIPVWVYQDQLTDDEIHWLVLDLAKVRKKSNVDLVNEYHLYNKLVPNNQGKKDVDQHRIDYIATMMGISVSRLKKLLSIDKVQPSLLRAVDDEVITLSNAEQKKKAIVKKRKDEEELKEMQKDVDDNPVEETTKYHNKDVDLEALPTCCPSCNRAFDTMTWVEIPDIFNYKRKEENKQTDWLSKSA